MSATLVILIVWFVLAFLDGTSNGHRHQRRNASKQTLPVQTNVSEGLNASDIDQLVIIIPVPPDLLFGSPIQPFANTRHAV